MITSPSNPRLKLVRRLLGSRRHRERAGLFVCEGEDLLEAALAAGIEPVDVLTAGETVEPRLLAELSTLGHPPRVLAVFRRADLPRLDGSSPSVGLALWRVGDPGNLGTLLRAADALGPAFVALSAGCADPVGPRALRASAGAVFRVPTAPFDEAPGTRVALVTRGEGSLAELALGTATTFVLGSEREGLPDDIAAGCAARATIPQATQAESLNVAMAGTIALYELARRSASLAS